MYNYVLGKWSLAEVEADLLAPMFSAGYTVDDLANLSATIDGLSIQLDSRFFKGGQYFFGGAFGDKIYTFTGAPMIGVIETGESPISSGKHSIVTRAYPYYENGTIEIAIGTRPTQIGLPTYTADIAPNAAGFVPFRAQGRYHRARLTLSGEWSKVVGLEIEARQIGRR